MVLPGLPGAMSWWRLHPRRAHALPPRARWLLFGSSPAHGLPVRCRDASSRPAQVVPSARAARSAGRLPWPACFLRAPAALLAGAAFFRHQPFSQAQPFFVAAVFLAAVAFLAVGAGFFAAPAFLVAEAAFVQARTSSLAELFSQPRLLAALGGCSGGRAAVFMLVGTEVLFELLQVVEDHRGFAA